MFAKSKRQEDLVLGLRRLRDCMSDTAAPYDTRSIWLVDSDASELGAIPEVFGAATTILRCFWHRVERNLPKNLREARTGVPQRVLKSVQLYMWKAVTARPPSKEG